MDDVFFKSLKDQEKFKNSLVISSLAELTAERRAAQIITGKQRPNFTIENNFIAQAEKEMKQRSGDEAALSRLYTSCFFRRLKFINKYRGNRYSEEGLLFSKAIFREQMKITVSCFISISAVIYGFYRLRKLQRSNRNYLYFGIGMSFVLSYFVGKYSSKFTRHRFPLLPDRPQGISRRL